MNIFIQTRDVYKDYTFLGNEPENWWADYAHYSSFEHPTVIVESNEQGWRLYLSGAKSSRVDKVNTPIRYSFVLSDDKKIEDTQELSSVLSLIQLWLAVIDESAPKQLQQKLDDLFTEQQVSEYIAFKQDKERDTKQIDQEVSNQFQAWLKPPDEFMVGDIEVEHSQIAAVKSKQAQAQFLNYCAKILKGDASQASSALYLNFVETQNELETINLCDENEYNRQFIILVNDSDQSLKDGLKDVEINKKKIALNPIHQKFSPTHPNPTIQQMEQAPLYRMEQQQNGSFCNSPNKKLFIVLAVVGVVGILYLISR